MKLRNVIGEVVDYLHDSGYELPEALKRRDKREPGRVDKERMEDKFNALMKRYFRKQAERVKEWVETRYSTRQDIDLPGDLIDGLSDDELMADVTRLVYLSGVGGIELFKKNIAVGVDWTLINSKALEFARKYAFDLIKNIDAVTVEAVRSAVTTFVETPGFTLGNLMDMLPFDEARSFRVARTEVTRAFANGQRMAGEELKEQYPDVAVYKKWFTHETACDLCLEIEERGEIEADEPFYDPDEYSDGEPPRHVNCYCWVQYFTRIHDR